MDYYLEPPKNIPILGTYDLCVLGGGCTGVFAAVRAARLGVRVALIERNGYLGGMSTQAGINVWHSIYDFAFENQIIAGLTCEVLDALRIRGDLIERKKQLNMFILNTDELKIELDRLVIREKIDVYFHSVYAAPIYHTASALKGILLENKDGRRALLAKIFIDATGDGDLCRDIHIPKNVNLDFMNPPTMCCRIYKKKDYPRLITDLLREHGEEFGLEDDWGWNTDIPGIPQERFLAETLVLRLPCISAENITRAEVEGREQIRAIVDLLRKYMPDGDPVRISAIADTVGIREGNLYHTEYCLKDIDVLGSGEAFSDTILNSAYPMDIHHDNATGLTMRYLDGTEKICNRAGVHYRRWRKEQEINPIYWRAPYRMMLTHKMDNVLVAGRMIYCEHGAFSALRVRINLNQLGEAAGVASYLALCEDNNVKKIDVGRMQTLLRQGGSILL